MDLVRSCYASTMRMYENRPDLEVPGRWRFCSPDAKVIDFPHAFASSIWLPDNFDTGDIGEARRTSSYFRGDPVEEYKGDKPFGDRSWWTRGAPDSLANLLPRTVSGAYLACSLSPPKQKPLRTADTGWAGRGSILAAAGESVGSDLGFAGLSYFPSGLAGASSADAGFGGGAAAASPPTVVRSWDSGVGSLAYWPGALASAQTEGRGEALDGFGSHDPAGVESEDPAFSPGSPCIACQEGTTPSHWTFSASEFDESSGWNGTWTVPQWEAFPCSWTDEWAVGQVALIQIDSVESTLQLTIGFTVVSTYHRLNAGEFDCSVPMVLEMLFSGIGGPATITLYPA